MQIKNIEYFRNKEINKPCLLVGGSDSARKLLLKKFRGIVICFGDSLVRYQNKIKPKYWIASNEFFPVPEVKSHLKLINESKTTLLLSYTNTYGGIRNYSENRLKKIIKTDWFVWDHIHKNKKKCKIEKKCCNLISKKNNSILDSYSKYLNVKNKFKTPSGTIAVEALAFSIYLGCKEIYIAGVDLPLTRDEHYGNIFKKNAISTEKKISKYLNDGILNYKKIQLKEKKISSRIKFFLYRNFKNHYQKLVDLKNSKINFRKFNIASAFEVDYKKIKFNFEFIFKTSIKKNILIYNLSEKSNLNSFKGIKKKFEFLK